VGGSGPLILGKEFVSSDFKKSGEELHLELTSHEIMTHLEERPQDFVRGHMVEA
jgi:hypothetical protein